MAFDTRPPAPFAPVPPCSPSPKAGSLTRRSLLAGGLALGLAPKSAVGAAPRGRSAAPPAIPFGGAIQHEYFHEEAYRQAFLRHCDLIVPMNELKWSLVHPEPGVFDFERADALVDFALSNGRASRGHTFVWWNSMPDWLTAISSAAEAERELVRHIETLCDHYRGRLAGWDVVNEVIANDPRGTEPMRDSFWQRLLGVRHVDIAFHTAARSDPGARLVLNDYDLEFKGPLHDAKRAVALALVRRLQDLNIPIHAVGMQGHLYVEREIDMEAVVQFGAALKRLGVGLLVTELDIIHRYGDPAPQAQDAAAAKIVGDLLDGVFAGQTPEAVISWGLTDRYSWIHDSLPRRDGEPSRPLPLDRHYREKPWLTLVREKLASAGRDAGLRSHG